MKRLQWLEDQLDRDDLSLKLRRQYEDEADARAAMLSKQQEQTKKLKEERKKEMEAIREKLLAGDISIIDTHGIPEFGDDYEVQQEGNEFIVYSKAAQDWQDHRRVHSTAEAADKDFRYLIRNRLYDRYVRSGEHDDLKELIQS